MSSVKFIIARNVPISRCVTKKMSIEDDTLRVVLIPPVGHTTHQTINKPSV